jgi:hypothetical protein
MRVIGRRVCRLEQRMGIAAPSAEELRIIAVAESVRRRRAERLGQPFLPSEERVHNLRSIAEIIRSARQARASAVTGGVA